MLNACNQAFAVLGSEFEDLKRANAVSLVCIPETIFARMPTVLMLAQA